MTVDLWPVCPGCERTVGVDVRPGACGFCRGCYRKRLRQGSRAYRSADSVAEEYRRLRDSGAAPSLIPEMMGMTGAAFERAMYRLRGAGDARVADWQRVSS